MPSTTVVTRANAPVQSLLEPEQALKASKALLAHMKKSSKEHAAKSDKKNLLDDEDDPELSSLSETPIWLTLTTKRHIRSNFDLKPAKIALPHSLNSDPEATICLIVADPQRAYKDIVASDEFPEELRKRVTRVVDVTHLKKKFKQYENLRKLFSEHEIFLADDRIVNRLPKVLGKTFYKTTTKRPVPVVFANPRPKVDGKRVKQTRGKDELNVRPTPQIVSEIEKALGSALINLSASTNTSIKIGYAGFKPEHVAANINALVPALVERFVDKKWSNVQGIFIKGPETAALPVWLTKELWLDGDKDVLGDGSEELKAIESKKEKANVGKKRKSIPNELETKEERQSKKPKVAAVKESNDDVLDKQIAERKEKLKKQKKAAKKAAEV